jgi:hypothetical protein
MRRDLRKHQLSRVHFAPAVDLIAEPQTLHSQFKSVTGEIMKNCCGSFAYQRLPEKRWNATDAYTGRRRKQ